MSKGTSRAWDQQQENPKETAKLEQEKLEQARKQQKESNSKKK
jgi:hypothetical protein